MTSELKECLHPSRPRFDMTINLGHVLVGLTMMASVLLYWRAQEMDRVVMREELKSLILRQTRIEDATEKLAASLHMLTVNVTKLQVLVEMREQNKPKGGAQ